MLRHIRKIRPSGRRGWYIVVPDFLVKEWGIKDRDLLWIYDDNGVVVSPDAPSVPAVQRAARHKYGGHRLSIPPGLVRKYGLTENNRRIVVEVGTRSFSVTAE